MAAKGVKKAQSTNRAGSAVNKEAASIAASLGENRKRLVSIWPEWSDADINGEKWEVAHKGKEKDKGKSPVQQHYFDDPDGKVDLPQCLRVDSWKRPADFITDKIPVVVDPEGYNGFDLLTPNEACFESELLRWIVGQIIALWKQSEYKNPDGTPGTIPIDPANPSLGEYNHTWRPWEHVYAINKPGKGFNMPAFNPHGKYVVKLYWLGSWRKIIVDDSMPFDEAGNPLLPMTSLQCELWPMLLTKALIKVASLDYAGGNPSCEFGDFSVIHCLTSWLPEAIPLQQGHLLEIWKLLQSSVPEFKLPEPKPEPELVDGESKENLLQEGTMGDKSEASKDKAVAPEKSDVKTADKKDKKDDKGKDAKKDKKDKDKDKGKEKSIVQDEIPLPEHPEVMMFASYSGPPKYPVRVSVLRDMADASETLRQKGLSHLYPHPVLITQTRACPLEPPPPPEKIPAWKLIRPKKKKTTPTDEPVDEVEVVEKPIQCVQITSPFINYKVSPIPIPTDIHRPRSELERGQSRMCSRPGTANVETIEETDENAPTPEPEPPQILKVEEPPVEELPEPPKEEKASSGKGGKKKDKDKANAAVAKKSDESMSGKKSPSSGKQKRDAGSASKTRTDPNKPTSDGKKTSEKAMADSAKGSKSDTLAVPSMEDGLGDDDLGEEEEAVKEDPQTHSEEMWMDFDEFCKCFKTLYIYHKTHTYPYNYKNSDLKHVTSGKDSKKTNPNTAAGGITEDKSPYYLFVDSLKPTELVVSMSSLSRWPESTPPPIKEEQSKADLKAGKAKEKDRESRVEAMTAESSSMVDTGNQDVKVFEPVQPGLLVAEPYSWKSLVTGQPILRVRTSGVRSAVLSLPPGRHVLRFNITAPLGYHHHLCSSTPFVFGDEEKVMAELTKESCRFVENAVQVMAGLGKCIQGFSDPELIKVAWEEFYAAHCPYRDDRHSSKTHHWNVFMDALYSTLKKYLTEANLATMDMSYAWRCFFFDAITKNPLGAASGSSSRPATGMAAPDRNSAKQKGGKKREPSDAKLEDWKKRLPTEEELVASVKIQRLYRGYRVRKIKTGRTTGTEDNVKVAELLMKAWAVMEPNAEQIGLQLFRAMFKKDPDLMPKYPFYQDEWNKISFADYQGSYPDQPPNTWFVVFREVFFVHEEMLLVPKLYVPINTCMLRVVDNDTGAEIPKVFQKVAPHVYKKNKNGYTFVAEARTTEQALLAGRWRMRLIGSLTTLPSPQKPDTVNSTFHNRELRDYYLPNDKNLILRYTVKAAEDHLASLQLQTSKPDVYIKLQILDHEEELLSTVGKGHAVLPAIIFKKDPDDPLRAGSRASIKEKEAKDKAAKVTIKSRRASSAASRSSSAHRRSISSVDDEEEEAKPHKFIIQAQVMRESWPLSEAQWVFVQQLKQAEKEELKVAQKERPPSPPKDQKKETKGKDKGKGKGGKDKDKDKGKDNSRPPSQQFDFTKPNWTLRIVSDGPQAEELEVKKDTERADEIRAMKKAWEDAEPGRAAKGQQSRLQYLNSHIIKAEEDEEAPKEGDVPPPEPTSPLPPAAEVDPDAPLFNEPPPPPAAKEVLQPIDLQPFVRKTHERPVFRDESEIQRQLEAKQQEIQTYRSYRDRVEKWREEDRQQRNQDKVQQIQLCENLQAALDAAREAVNSPREAFRQKYLEAERRRLEEIQAQEAAMRAEMEKSTPTPKGGKKSAKGKKSASGKKKK